MGSSQFVVRSGERELSLKTQRSAQRQPVAAAARRPRVRVKRVNISRRALRVVVEGEPRETTKEHTRAGLYLRTDTLSHSPDDDDRTPGILSGSFGVWRARPPGTYPLLTPTNPLRLCERETTTVLTARGLPSRRPRFRVHE